MNSLSDELISVASPPSILTATWPTRFRISRSGGWFPLALAQDFNDLFFDYSEIREHL